MPVGKGMGLSQHYETLKVIRQLGDANTKSLMIELNKKYAWWDDPEDKAPTETCRSYIKELWRLGLIIRITDGEEIPLDEEHWKSRKTIMFRISPRGIFILKQNKKTFPYYVAWCILEAVKNKVYPQCDKLFKLYDKHGKIPVSDEETAMETKKRGIYVEKHAGKTIKFGWLEPTGLIYRSSRQFFKVNENFKKFMEDTKLEELLSNIDTQVDNEYLTIILNEPYLDYRHFDRGTDMKFSFKFTNNTKKEIRVKLVPHMSSVFEHVANLNIDKKEIILIPNKPNTVTISMTSVNHGFSDSFSLIFCGILNIHTEYGRWSLYCPSVIIAKKDRVWEHEVLERFQRLNLKTFHFGRSDRPDGIIDISGLTDNPPDLLKYLRDGNKEKMLMETTDGEYTWMKRYQDTQITSKREDKYTRHTTKVLKIKAVGQMVAASKFSKDIQIIEDSRDHIITLMDMDTLDYLVAKKKESGNGRQSVIKILKLDKKVEKTDINSVFEESE